MLLTALPARTHAENGDARLQLLVIVQHQVDLPFHVSPVVMFMPDCPSGRILELPSLANPRLSVTRKTRNPRKNMEVWRCRGFRRHIAHSAEMVGSSTHHHRIQWFPNYQLF